MKPIFNLFVVSLFITMVLSGCRTDKKGFEYNGQEYQEIKSQLADGWNTWNTYSVLSHVLLPEALSINLYAYDRPSDRLLKQAFIGNKAPGSEIVIPGDHACDGSYTDLEIYFESLAFRVQTSSNNDSIYLLITPIQDSLNKVSIIHPDSLNKGSIILQAGVMWNRAGEILPEEDCMHAVLPGKQIKIYPTATDYEFHINDTSFEFSLSDTIGISSGQPLELDEIINKIESAKKNFQCSRDTTTEFADVLDAIQTLTAWNTIYDHADDRVITPSSRIWNTGWDGYVLFCWDTYFVSYMLSVFNRELAYANAIEISNEITESGFVPNFTAGQGLKSLDRSMPPVGSLMVKEVYRKYREKWFLYEVYDNLLTWNRWWPENRDTDGLLCWGSNPYEPVFDDPREKVQNVLQGAKYESGLDNSPMYDGVSFDSLSHQMRLADVGLTSLYIADCKALAEIAIELGEEADARELQRRANRYAENLEELMWDKWFGLHLNRHTDTKVLSKRISPTNFYPMLASATTAKRADRMINYHFFYKKEFYGDWIIPSIARNDTAYSDNSYWRGRIWAPMNFLVYLGLRNYDFPRTRQRLSDRSAALLLKDWGEHRFVHENYNAETGEGDDVSNSDNFYHWGGLLGMIYLIENGYVLPPEIPLTQVPE